MLKGTFDLNKQSKMNNNDIMRRIRYIFDYKDSKMIEIFALADKKVSRDQIIAWLKKEQDEEFELCSDQDMTTFLNGLISEKRGKREGVKPPAEKVLNNNIVLKKLKIALNFKEEDILHVMKLADFKLSRHELSALFRKHTHKNYRECQNQVLRNFLKGVQLKYRDVPKTKVKAKKPNQNIWKK